MSIQSINITNLLSFDELVLDDLKDINCIVGRNNVGKSNLFKLLKFFYSMLEGKNVLPPTLYSNYSYKGSISITFDTTRIFRIARRHPNNKYFAFIVRKLIPMHKRGIFALQRYDQDQTSFTLSLNVYNDGSIKWLTKDKQTLNLILYLFPFFHIEPRHMDLHEWDSLWDLIARLKSFNLSDINDESVIDFFDKSINLGGEHSYKNYINELNDIIPTKSRTQKEKILNYIKSGLKGYEFEINESDLKFQSDGTNSFYFIKTFLKILITISRREYITPFVFIDEPELGLHPKMNETLISDIYSSYNYTTDSKITRPRVFITTHSPNIVKEVIRRFRDKQCVFCFQKQNEFSTKIQLLNSTYDSESFLNIFSDNEARLFFSDFILFVEGETELEIFGNIKLSEHFPHLKNVDIYKSSSNVIGERINPSYSNSAIPYMFLFDADKAITICGNESNSYLKYAKNGAYYNLSKECLLHDYNRYKLGFSKEYMDIKLNIGYLIHCSNKSLKLNKTKQDFLDESEFEQVFNALKSYLLLKRFYINRTTFEGCLIQVSSATIFYDWLLVRYEIDMNPILKRVKSSKYLTEEMLIDYMRVIFHGKTKTLIDYKSFNMEAYKQAIQKKKLLDSKLNKTSKRAKVLMDLLERETKRNKFLNKTDGWTTSFLNFAIDRIKVESLTKKQSFSNTFGFYFPELYDIVRRLQPDSRGKI